MSITTKLVTTVDMLLHAISTGKYQTLKDYCFLETAKSSTTMVGKDGSFINIFLIHGSKKYVGGEEILELQNKLGSSLQDSFKKEGHQLQFVFTRDVDRIKSELKRSLNPYWNASRNLGLNLDDIFESKINHLSNFCSYESCYMVAISRPSLIAMQLKDEREESFKKSKDMPPAFDAQNLFNDYEALENKHNAFINSLENTFRISNINYSILEVRRSIREVRKLMHNDLTGEDWTPFLPGATNLNKIGESRNQIPMRDEKSLRRPENDISDLLWPSLSEQVFPADFSIEENQIVKIDDKYIASMYVDLPPQHTVPFSNLLNSIEREIPFQISLSIEGGAISKSSMKILAAAILSFSNATNKLIKDALSELRDMELHGNSIVKMKINAITWAKNKKDLNLRKQTVMKSISSWGSINVKLSDNDPVENVLSTMPGIMASQSGTPFLAPIRDIISLLPLTRQSHVWETGAVTFRTVDGKVFPYQPGSSEQTTWNDIIFAIPGSGKSVLMNSNNLAAVITPGSEELPLIGILDIGPSSSGLIQLIKDALPDNKKHLAIYERLQNTEEFAINVFDTQLGCRRPSPSDRMLLINFLTLLLTPAGMDKPYPSSDNMISAIVDMVYQKFEDSNTGQPKEYIKNKDKEIEKVLAKHNIDAEGLCWWEVVDELFKKKEYRLASIAQRYAVPRLQDCVSIAQKEPAIYSLYSKPHVETGEDMIQLFNRAVSEAINQFPILNMPTQFDLGEARIISLDLDEVAKSGSATSAKQSGIMFMLGRYIVGKNFKLNKEFIRYSPKIYHEYHLERVKNIRQVKKRLCIDEFHRTSSVPSFRQQVVTDQREGRKWNLQVVLASQMAEDFDDDMLGMATGVFILSGGNNYKKVTEQFNLNKTTSEIVKNHLNGPSSLGVPFVFNFTTKKGAYSQYLMSTISSIELWAFTTTAEDSTLKERLNIELNSPAKARRILAKEFPNGSAKDYIEKLVEESGDPRIASNPYAFLISKLNKKYKDIIDENY